MLNGKILAFANRLEIYHRVFAHLSSHVSLRSELYVVAGHVRLDLRSCFRLENESESKWSNKFIDNTFLEIFIIMVIHSKLRSRY